MKGEGERWNYESRRAGQTPRFVREMVRVQLMDLREYQRHVAQIGFGKKLPTAVYVYRADGGHDLGVELSELVVYEPL